MKLRLVVLPCIIASLAGFLIAFMPGCDGHQDARAIWRDGIQKCAANDLLGPNVLYFGPSNGDGPGTVFQTFASGGTQVSHLLSEYEPAPASVLDPNPQRFPCGTNGSWTTTISGGLSLPDTLKISGDIAANLNKAKTVTINATSIEWDQLVTGPYKSLVLGLPDANSVKVDLLQGKQLVLTRALKVSGMTADLEFTSDIGPKVKLSMPNGPLKGIGVNFSAEWKSDTKLTISSTADFYVAGELRTFSQTGLAGGEANIGPLVPRVAKIKVRTIAQ
jgi:hypothetical protein